MPRPCPFLPVLKTARCDRGPDFVEAEAKAALTRLGMERAYAIVVEQAGDLFGPHGPALWSRLRRMRDEGLVERIGVSATPPTTRWAWPAASSPDIVQAPASLLDQRLIVSGALAEMAEDGHRGAPALDLPAGPVVPAARPGAGAAAERLAPPVARAPDDRRGPQRPAAGRARLRPVAPRGDLGHRWRDHRRGAAGDPGRGRKPAPDLDWDDMAIDDRWRSTPPNGGRLISPAA
ncbi:MAG: bifunctional regulator KidO [Caulobacteraceae bacterium]